MAEDETVQGSSEGAEAPAIDFNTFVLSLSTSALMHLGVAAPEGRRGRAQLAIG